MARYKKQQAQDLDRLARSLQAKHGIPARQPKSPKNSSTKPPQTVTVKPNRRGRTGKRLPDSNGLIGCAAGCGARIPVEATFCPMCGKQLKALEPKPALEECKTEPFIRLSDLTQQQESKPLCDFQPHNGCAGEVCKHKNNTKCPTSTDSSLKAKLQSKFKVTEQVWSRLVTIYTPERMAELNERQLAAMTAWEVLQQPRIDKGFPHCIWAGMPK